jgi:hypothetical protein
MTAEVGILNSQGLALAADSAVTIGLGRKIYPSANKIFMLSKYEPVGIMIYGSADLHNMPWETIIKTYRKRLGETRFDTLQEYCDNFIHYLENNDGLIDLQTQDLHSKSTIFSYLHSIREDIEN